MVPWNCWGLTVFQFKLVVGIGIFCHFLSSFLMNRTFNDRNTFAICLCINKRQWEERVYNLQYLIVSLLLKNINKNTREYKFLSPSKTVIWLRTFLQLRNTAHTPQTSDADTKAECFETFCANLCGLEHNIKYLCQWLWEWTPGCSFMTFFIDFCCIFFFVNIAWS